MKIVKTVFLSILAIFVVAIVGLFIFLKTFNLNDYLPQITKAASDSLKRDVKIEGGDFNISMSGIVLDLKTISISDVDPAKPFLNVKSAHAKVDVIPLITKAQIQISEIVFINTRVIMADPKMPLDVNVPSIQAKVQNFSLDNAFPIELDVTFASETPNIHATANVQVVAAQSKAIITNAVVTTDLNKLKMDYIKAISPVLAAAPLPLSLSGQIKADIALLEVSAKGLENVQAHAEVIKGGASLKELLKPITNIKVILDADMAQIDIKEFSLNIEEGRVTGQAKLADYLKAQQFTATTKINGVKAEDLVDQTNAPVVVKGKINGNVSVSGQGFAPAALTESLAGQGDFAMTEGVIEKLNILKAVLGSTFAKIPGLAESVDGFINSSIKEKLGDESNVLQTAQAKFTIINGLINLNEAVVVTKPFDLNASGTIGVADLNTNITTNILIEQELSRELKEELEQLAYLGEENGRLKISGRLTGPVTSPKFIPSVELKNVVVQEGMNQLDKAIEKNPELAPAKELINGVLNNIFK